MAYSVEHDMLHQGGGESQHVFSYRQGRKLLAQMLCQTRIEQRGNALRCVSFIRSLDTFGACPPRAISALFERLSTDVGEYFVWDKWHIGKEEKNILRIAGYPYVENFSVSLLEKSYTLLEQVYELEVDEILLDKNQETSRLKIVDDLSKIHEILFQVAPILLYRVRPWLFRSARFQLERALDTFRELKEFRDSRKIAYLDEYAHRIPLFSEANMDAMHSAFDQAESELLHALS